MCIDDGSRPLGEAIAILRPPTKTTGVSANEVNPESVQLSIAFSNAAMGEQRGERNTHYQYFAIGGSVELGQDCQIRIQLSTTFLKLTDEKTSSKKSNSGREYLLICCR